MLSSSFRTALFFLFLGIFLISAPLSVLYTAGYRFNRTNNLVLQTGSIAFASIPPHASVVLDAVMLPEDTPTVVQRVSEGIHTVALEKSDFYPWKQRITVNKGGTTYVTAPLFLHTAPLLASDADRTAFAALHTTQELPFLSSFRTPLTPTFTSTGDSVIVSFDTSDVVSILPLETYTPLVVSDAALFVEDTRHNLFFIHPQKTQSAQLLGKDVLSFSWSPDEGLFVWTDGIEVSLFSTTEETSTLITRQTDLVTALAFTHRGQGLALASREHITGIDLTPYVDGRLFTTLLTFESDAYTISFSPDGDIAYLVDISGALFTLAITP